MSLKLHFLRHGQTDSSRDNIYCGGEVNALLTRDGHSMAEQFAQAYKNTPWQAMYVSPQQRAQDTAAPLHALCQSSLEVREELREIRYGSWDGKTVDEVKTAFAGDYKAWLADPAWVAPSGGETAFDVARRAVGLLRDICKQHKDGNLLFVSHKATIRIMLCALLGIDLAQFRYRLGCPVASLSMVELAAHGPLLHKLADISHLDQRLQSLSGT